MGTNPLAYIAKTGPIEVLIKGPRAAGKTILVYQLERLLKDVPGIKTIHIALADGSECLFIERTGGDE